VSPAQLILERPQEVAEASITALESFAFDYAVQWPVSLVVSKKAIIRFVHEGTGIIFRASTRIHTVFPSEQMFCLRTPLITRQVPAVVPTLVLLQARGTGGVRRLAGFSARQAIRPQLFPLVTKIWGSKSRCHFHRSLYLFALSFFVIINFLLLLLLLLLVFLFLFLLSFFSLSFLSFSFSFLLTPRRFPMAFALRQRILNFVHSYQYVRLAECFLHCSCHGGPYASCCC
jgi:hypothetical protein